MTFTMPIRAAVVLAVAAAMLAATLTFAPADADAACAGAKRAGQSKSRTARAVLCLINVQRARHGLPPVRADRRLRRVASTHARDTVRFHFMGHTSPTHGGLSTRVQRAGYRPRSGGRIFFGEILGAGSGYLSSPRQIVRAWMHHHIHRTAILYRAFRTAGAGIASGMPNNRRRGRSFVVTFGS